MDDSMIGRWLSELPMDDPTHKSFSKPLLRRFIHHDKPITRLGRISLGTEGIVLLVEIEGVEYVMKLFFKWEHVMPHIVESDRLSERQKPYLCPFSRECRAFARLDSMGKNGTFAVKCHGWLKLSDEQFEQYSKYPQYSRWAIIKDYLPDPATRADIPEMKHKMEIAHKALLYPQDQKPENYRGSFMVDLGSTKTWPFPKSQWWEEGRKLKFKYFHKGVEEWEFEEDWVEPCCYQFPQNDEPVSQSKENGQIGKDHVEPQSFPEENSQ
ncbi:hypothetical protein GX50_02523 [[Emmonsia] crescens]|uniref:Uncharacterized protein n=1 Tax=[Emmonsia] crescens TaxID=73230 RepID=A0A2B7ZN84_9EURO|nr:hypothetical protein GX50_02523 [Emmonsia crescens]